MSAKIMGRVWELDLPHNEAWVLMSLSDHAHHDGSNVYPSLALTAWKTGYSERQIQRIISNLLERKILIAESVNRGKGRPNIYRIRLDHVPTKPDIEKWTGCPPSVPKVDISETKSVPQCPKGGHIDVQQTSNQVTEPKEGTLAIASPPVVPSEVAPEATPEVSEHRRFTECWVAAYGERFKAKYFFTGAKDGAAVSRLLAAGETVDSLIASAREAWAKLGTGFLYQQSTTIAGFASKLNEIRAMLSPQGQPAPQRPVWMQIRDLETERRPLAEKLEEYNNLLQHDCNRTAENVIIRKEARERVAAIDALLSGLRAQ